MSVIIEKKLANGLNLSISDQSRPVAADRWQVRVVCSLVLPVRPEAHTGLETGDPELGRLTGEGLGDRLEHFLIRERNFVDQAVKDEVVGALATQLQDLVCRYLEGDAFPARLVAAKCRELGELRALERARDALNREEDNEPADFSHCFR